MTLDPGLQDASYFRQYFQQYYGSRSWRDYNWLLNEVMTYSQPGPILDVGAGLGFFVECAQRWGLDCEGIDGSSDAIQMAKSRYAPIRLSQHFLSQPILFDGNRFDTVVMNQVIEHLEPAVAMQVVNQVFRILKPGGSFLVFSPCRYDKEQAAEEGHINLYSPVQLRSFLSSVGFVDVLSTDSSMVVGNRFLSRMVSLVHSFTKWDRLSATANCVAYKPQAV